MEFEQYQDRSITFVENQTIDEICVKIYTITNREKFEANITYDSAIKQLPNWINTIKTSTIPTHNNAFLMVHEAREGTLILLCWFTGENMIETKIYYADFNTPSKIGPSVYKEKQLVCVWELEIIWHERKAWIKHVLSKPEAPDFKSYQESYFVQ